MKRVFLIWIVGFVFCVLSVRAQGVVSAKDKAAITQAALDYIEGWYEGNTERMELALHPFARHKKLVRFLHPADNRDR